MQVFLLFRLVIVYMGMKGYGNEGHNRKETAGEVLVPPFATVALNVTLLSNN